MCPRAQLLPGQLAVCPVGAAARVLPHADHPCVGSRPWRFGGVAMWLQYPQDEEGQVSLSLSPWACLLSREGGTGTLEEVRAGGGSAFLPRAPPE